MGLPKNEHLTEDASARLLEEAVKTSCSKAGEETSLTETVSRQTVMNQLHSLKFPEEQDIPEEKKKVDYLYIDADEDHVALQYLNTKGDLKKARTEGRTADGGWCRGGIYQQCGTVGMGT